ncbi:MAG: DUF1993 family protein [Pseudanabaenaceae cyanobacterium]|jgi:hypothetical protein
MTVSMYQVLVPSLVRTFNNLVGILEKAAAHATAKNIDPTVLINARLYPDMFALARQVQIATDIGRKGAARLADVEVAAYADQEASFPELIERVKNTITFLESLTPEQIDGTEEKEINLSFGKQSFSFLGQPYVLGFILPNVYFHVTTTYGILRHCGVELGKVDFLGKPE